MGPGGRPHDPAPPALLGCQREPALALLRLIACDDLGARDLLQIIEEDRSAFDIVPVGIDHGMGEARPDLGGRAVLDAGDKADGHANGAPPGDRRLWRHYLAVPSAPAITLAKREEAPWQASRGTAGL